MFGTRDRSYISVISTGLVSVISKHGFSPSCALYMENCTGTKIEDMTDFAPPAQGDKDATTEKMTSSHVPAQRDGADCAAFTSSCALRPAQVVHVTQSHA